MSILITIGYGLLIWFNVGLLAQLIMCFFDGIINRRWPVGWDDGYHFLLAGAFGFLSMINAIVFIIRFSINPEDFEADEEEIKEMAKEEGAMYISGLTEEEQEKVAVYLQSLLDIRNKKDTENVE